MKIPLGVQLISGFYVFGAIGLLLSIPFYHPGLEPIGIAARFGLPIVPELAARLAIAVLSLIMAYGYVRLQRWGYWTMVGYSMTFGAISLLLSLQGIAQPFLGNFVFSVIVLLYTYRVKSVFGMLPAEFSSD